MIIQLSFFSPFSLPSLSLLFLSPFSFFTPPVEALFLQVFFFLRIFNEMSGLGCPGSCIIGCDVFFLPRNREWGWGCAMGAAAAGWLGFV